jgi:hypothetical protein
MKRAPGGAQVKLPRLHCCEKAALREGKPKHGNNLD